MNPSRRGFLSLIPAGFFGGKQLAKEVLEKAATQAGLEGTGVALNAIPHPQIGAHGLKSIPSASKSLLKLASHAWQDRHWRETEVISIDSDIASTGSWSLSYKVLKQKERNFKASIESKKSYWEKVMMGDDGEDDWV